MIPGGGGRFDGSPFGDDIRRQQALLAQARSQLGELGQKLSQVGEAARAGRAAGMAPFSEDGHLADRHGYPEDPHPLAPARGIRNGLILAGGFWLVVFVLLLLARSTT